MMVKQVCMRLCSLCHWYTVVGQLLYLFFFHDWTSAPRPFYRWLNTKSGNKFRRDVLFYSVMISFFPLPDKMISLNMPLCAFHFGRFNFIKQGPHHWLTPLKSTSCLCVSFAFVWLVDPLHVGPPAPGPLTHIIKGKGLYPSIPIHKDEGHIIICIICLTWAPLKPPYSLSLPLLPLMFLVRVDDLAKKKKNNNNIMI